MRSDFLSKSCLSPPTSSHLNPPPALTPKKHKRPDSLRNPASNLESKVVGRNWLLMNEWHRAACEL